MRDDGMTNIKFRYSVNCRNCPHILIMQAVSGIDLQPVALARRYRAVYSGKFILLPVHGWRICIMAGVNFDGWRASVRRGLDLSGVGINEERYPDSSRRQFSTGALNGVKVAHDIEAALGRQFFASFGDQANVMRFDPYCEVRHLIGYRTFKIHTGFYQTSQDFNVTVLYVAAVLAQMKCNRIRPGPFRDQRCLYRVWISRAPRLPQCRDMIDIDT